MGSAENLHSYLIDSARRWPDATAVEDPEVGQVSYGELDALSDRLRDRLHRLGVRPGDRVGIYTRKCIDAVASIFGILKCGAVHVPVDAGAPISRAAYIMSNCSVKAAIVERRFVEDLRAEWGGTRVEVQLIPVEHGAAPLPLAGELARLDLADPAPQVPTVDAPADSLAYFLYTSGSTGKPKGVTISHRNARCFVDWCSDKFPPTETDRFSSHAPFHFDLSVLDIYLSLKHGATLVLINEEAGKDPVTLAALMAKERISCWYSTPSVLSLLAQFGHLERYEYPNLRIIHFAGEVFPVRHLRTLTQLLPGRRYFNLYGPTETNVCTYYEVPPVIPDDRTEPYPIGRPCAHVLSRVVDPEGKVVSKGEEGELWIGGPGVMQGYWNAPEMNERVFRTDEAGGRWYRTGDLVVESPDGDLLFRGRRDNMVKKRGFRIELGEIEAAMYRHADIKEAAVVALPNEESGVLIRAFLSFRGPKPSLIRLKQFCAEHLVSYMIPDQFSILDSLPKTSNDKIDYQTLKEMA
jgi:amino acid adenylation domain-containing protein